MALQLFDTDKTPRVRLYRGGKTPRSARSVYEKELNNLRDRGYKNEKLNLEKLIFYRGNIEAVITEYDLTPTSVPDGTKIFDESILSPLRPGKPEEEEFSPREEELLSKLFDLQSKISDLEAEHEEDIENLIHDHEQDVQEIRNEFRLRMRSLDAENESVKNAHRELLAENLSLKKKHRRTSMSNLNERRSRTEKLEYELERERKAVEEMEETIESLEKQNHSLAMKLKKFQKESDRLQTEANSSQSKIISLENLALTQNDLVESLQTKVIQLEDQVRELESNLEMVETEREHHNNLIVDLEKRNAESEDLIESYDAELVVASEQLEACVERIDALERELSTLRSCNRHRTSFLEWFDDKFLPAPADDDNLKTPRAETSSWRQYREKFVECNADDLTWWVDLMASQKKEASSESPLSVTDILSDWIGMDVEDQKTFCRQLEEMEVFVAAKAGLKGVWNELELFQNEVGRVSWTNDSSVDLIQNWGNENSNRLSDLQMAKLMFYVSMLC